MADIALRVASNTQGFVTLVVDVPGVDKFSFTFNAGSAWAAQLLAQAVQKRLGRMAERVREGAYADGWKDAKAKRRKATFFDSIWGVW